MTTGGQLSRVKLSEALLELASKFGDLKDCLLLAAKLGFDDTYVFKWVESRESTEMIATKILLQWNANWAGNEEAKQLFLESALAGIQMNLASFFQKKCEESSTK